MGALWTPEAIDLKPAGTSGTMSGVGGPRATAHVTVSPSGAKTVSGKVNPDGWFWAMHAVLTGKRAEPHYLYDPLTDKLGQYFPLNKSARALAQSNFLPYSHNKVGTVNIQVEVVADTGDFTRYWKPGPNFRAMMRDIRSWGIADRFIFRLADTAADRSNVVRPNRLLTSTEGGGQWWGHCHYGDGESHWDPDCDEARFFAAGKPLAPPKPITPTTSPTPTVATKEGPSMFLVKIKGTDPLYKSDGFRRVHVTPEQRDALKAGGVPITEVKDAKALAAYGPEVTA